MAEFNIQSDSVDVTRIMEQIRQRIREKRGRDYTEQQIRELATVKLERFLDPQQIRSDLVEHYRQLEPAAALEPFPHDRSGPAPEQFDFDEHTIYASSRGTMGTLIRLIRKLLNPILKLFLNPTPVVFALSRQAEINAWTLQLLQQQTKQLERAVAKSAAREDLDALNYEVLNNLVVEMTRLSVDMKNHRSLVESVAGRLDFDERRARALESVVQSRSPQPHKDKVSEGTDSTESGRPRRRRRRPRRRPSGTATGDSGTNSDTGAVSSAQGKTAEPVPPADTVTRQPVDTAAPDTVSPPRHGTEPPPVPLVEPSTSPPEATRPPPASAQSPDPVPTTPTAPPIADAGSPEPPPPPPTPGQRDAPAPATAPATERVAPTSPTGDAGTDEQ
jgi:hypothetical protein